MAKLWDFIMSVVELHLVRSGRMPIEASRYWSAPSASNSSQKLDNQDKPDLSIWSFS